MADEQNNNIIFDEFTRRREMSNNNEEDDDDNSIEINGHKVRNSDTNKWIINQENDDDHVIRWGENERELMYDVHRTMYVCLIH